MFEKMLLKQLLNTSFRPVPATYKNKQLNLLCFLWDTSGILRKYSGSNAIGKCVNPVKKRHRNHLRYHFSFKGPGHTGKLACMEPRSLVGRKPQPWGARRQHWPITMPVRKTSFSGQPHPRRLLRQLGMEHKAMSKHLAFAALRYIETCAKKLGIWSGRGDSNARP